MAIPLEEFVQAHRRIRKYVEPSLLRYSHWLSDLLSARVYLKFEALLPGRSFKIRGATNALLSQQKAPEKVITASGGNHGLGVAIAAGTLNIPCTVILPVSTSAYRVSLLENLGAQVLLHGAAWDEANKYALQLAKNEGYLYIHPFADREVIVGQGTIAMELFEQLPDIDAIVASVGGGGLLSGIALGIEALGKTVDLYAVETQGADCLHQSLAKDRVVELAAITSIAKTLGAKKTTEFIFQTMKRLLTKSYVVNDKEAVEMIFEFLDHEKILVEPATACNIAALLQHPEEFRGKTVVVIICGSNVSLDETMAWKKSFGIE